MQVEVAERLPMLRKRCGRSIRQLAELTVRTIQDGRVCIFIFPPTQFPPGGLMPRQRRTHRIVSTVAVVVAIIAGCCAGQTEANEFVLVRDGRPAATIVTAAAPSDVAAFSAQELQCHMQKITGATLPIKSDADKVEGARILVGPAPLPPSSARPQANSRTRNI